MTSKKDPIDTMSTLLKEARRAEELAVAKALIVREAAVAAAQTFRHYAQIHRAKGDEEKAARNEDEAVKLTLAIMATANLPDFRALSKIFETERDTLRARVAELEGLLGEAQAFARSSYYSAHEDADLSFRITRALDTVPGDALATDTKGGE